MTTSTVGSGVATRLTMHHITGDGPKRIDAVGGSVGGLVGEAPLGAGPVGTGE